MMRHTAYTGIWQHLEVNPSDAGEQQKDLYVSDSWKHVRVTFISKKKKKTYIVD